jgi:hypothetical protein
MPSDTFGEVGLAHRGLQLVGESAPRDIVVAAGSFALRKRSVMAVS